MLDARLREVIPVASSSLSARCAHAVAPSSETGTPVEVDVAPACAERLADVDARADHEGDEVGELAPASGFLRPVLGRVVGGGGHPGEQVPAFLRGEPARGARPAAADACDVADRVGQDRIVDNGLLKHLLDRRAHRLAVLLAHRLASSGGSGAQAPEEDVDLADGAFGEAELAERGQHGAVQLPAVQVEHRRARLAVGDKGGELADPELRCPLEAVMRPQRAVLLA
jgi:hypothetical protein